MRSAWIFWAKMSQKVHKWSGSPTHDRGPVQQVSHGRWVYPLDPRPEEIFIEDIAASLSKLCRYIGHSRAFYSVAQHSYLVSHLVPREHAMWGLLHDASEAYTGDISKPVKNAFESVAPGVFADLEEKIERAIATKFDLQWPMPSEVKTADIIALATEKRDLLHPSELDWGPLPEPDATPIWALDHSTAQLQFMWRYHEILSGQ